MSGIGTGIVFGIGFVIVIDSEIKNDFGIGIDLGIGNDFRIGIESGIGIG